MPLTELILHGISQRKIILHPDIKAKLLGKLRTRYEEEITPELWNDLLRSYREEGYFPENFLTETNRIAEDVVNIYAQENNIRTTDSRQLQVWAEEIWDESQSFWSEISDTIERDLDFVGRLIENSKKEIDTLFPQSDKVFGEKATQFLIDLAFQANLFGYTKVTKPYLVNIRRMINIAGQIVEEIISRRILDKEMNIGEIERLLYSFKKRKSLEKIAYFKKFPNGNILLAKGFLENLKVIRKARNSYSHGASLDQTIADDFPNCIQSLIDKQAGVLPTLYKLLNEIEA